MENSKKFMQNNDFIPFISFKEQNTHIVKLVADKEDVMTDKNTGEVKKGMKYLVEEDGTKKSFFTGSLGLISKLSAYKPGDIVTIKMVSSKGPKGFISSYEVYSGATKPLPKAETEAVPTISYDEDISPERMAVDEAAGEEIKAAW